MYANILQKYPPILQYYTSIHIYIYIYITRRPNNTVDSGDGQLVGRMFLFVWALFVRRDYPLEKHVLISNGWFISTFRNVLGKDA